MKKWKLIVSAILIILAGCHFILNEKAGAETSSIVSINNDMETKIIADKSTQPEVILKFDDIDEESVINNKEYHSVIDWLDKNTLLVLHNIIDYKDQSDTINKRLIFKKYQSEDDELAELSHFFVDIQLNEYNENLTSHYMDINMRSSGVNYYDIKCLLRVSPDKKNMLISIEDLVANEVDENVQVINEASNYIYNFNNEMLKKIPDNARYVSWSKDSKSLYGTSYSLTYNYNYEMDASGNINPEKGTTVYSTINGINTVIYEQIFSGNTYRHNKYTIDNNVVETIAELPNLKYECSITKKVYDEILNKKHEYIKEGNNILSRSRSVYPSTLTYNKNIEYILDTDMGLKECKNEYFRDYVLQSGVTFDQYDDGHIIVNEQGYVLAQSDKEYSIIGDKNLKSNYLIRFNQIVDNNFIICQDFGDEVSHALVSLNIKTNKVKSLYNGQIMEMAYSDKCNKLAFYDSDKKELFVADFNNGELTNIKSQYKGEGYISKIFFSQDGDKLYLSINNVEDSKLTSFIIDTDTDKTIEFESVY